MVDCNNNDTSCTATIGPDFGLNPDGTLKQLHNNQPCVVDANERRLPDASDDLSCSIFQLEDGRSNGYIDKLVNESLSIAGADFNVYKLLGVHEQSRLVDCVGRGDPLSNGDSANFAAANAFDKYVTEWRSVQRGAAVTAGAYIGYDFGNIKTPAGQTVYGVDTNIYKHIATIGIKQSSNPLRRATRARLERSSDGIKWYGVGIFILPDDDCLNTIQTRQSVPSRYWRIRPLDFNGTSDNEPWSISALQLFHNHIATEQYNIQDEVLLESRDRDYSDTDIQLSGYYDLMDNLSELSALGLEIPSMMIYATISFSACVALLGRPIVVGDIVELPSEAQYSSVMKRTLKWLEVTDVSWATEGYTPGWQPTLLRVVLQPAIASQETQDIFGDLGETVEGDTVLDIETMYQDYSDTTQTIAAEAQDAVPERGIEGSSAIRSFDEDEIAAAEELGIKNIQKLGLNPTGLYVEDAMPPNNAPFTESDEYPDAPNHGDYHRLTYKGLAGDIPSRLYRYSTAKNRWVYLETDLRAKYDEAKPTLNEFITSPHAVPNSEITGTNETIDKDCEET